MLIDYIVKTSHKIQINGKTGVAQSPALNVLQFGRYLEIKIGKNLENDNKWVERSS